MLSVVFENPCSGYLCTTYLNMFRDVQQYREIETYIWGQDCLWCQLFYLSTFDSLSQGEPEVVEFNNFANRSLRPANPDMVRHYTDSSGKPRIQGGAALKGSQSYPRLCLGFIKGSSVFLWYHWRAYHEFLWWIFSPNENIQNSKK